MTDCIACGKRRPVHCMDCGLDAIVKHCVEERAKTIKEVLEKLEGAKLSIRIVKNRRTNCYSIVSDWMEEEAVRQNPETFEEIGGLLIPNDRYNKSKEEFEKELKQK